MTPRRKDILGQRLQALAYWLAFGAVVTVLWIALPSQAADTAVAQAAAASSRG